MEVVADYVEGTKFEVVARGHRVATSRWMAVAAMRG